MAIIFDTVSTQLSHNIASNTAKVPRKLEKQKDSEKNELV